MDKLKELLGDLFDQVQAKIGDKKLLVDDGSYIPEHRFKEKVEEVKSLKERTQKFESDIEKLKVYVAGNEVLAKQLADAQEAKKKSDEEAVARQLTIQKEFAIKEALLDAKVYDADARDLLARKFDINKIELDEKGKAKGIEEVLKPMQTNPVFQNFFGTRKISGMNHSEGELDLTQSELEKNNPFSKATRNIAKQVELKRTNPELAKRLEKSAK